MVYEANAQNILIGVSSYSDYPKDALTIPIISDFQTLYIEKILSIAQKLRSNKKKTESRIFALAWNGGTPKHFAEILTRYNIKTIWLSTNSTQDVLTNIFIISRLADLNYLYDLLDNNSIGKNISKNINLINKYQEQANKINLKLANILYNTANNYINTQPKSYFYAIWQKPLMTIYGDNYTDSLLSNCNIYNIFKSSKTSILNPEALLTNNPDIIIYEDKSNFVKLEKFIPKFIANKNVSIDADLLVRPTARSIISIPEICKKLRD